MKKLKHLVYLSILLIVSCENQDITNEQTIQNSKLNSETALGNIASGRSPETDCHFEYEGAEGPENWAHLCGSDWLDCDGNSQSPINIITSIVEENESLSEIQNYFSDNSTTILNNGHTLQFDYDNGSYSKLNGIYYDLKQFHFHTGSEHTINGTRYPMEVHLVHQDPISGNLAVIGILFEEGDKNNLLENFTSVLPIHEDETYVSTFSYNILDLINDDDDELEYYTYSGSLTTPPCSEIVTWYLIKEPIEASKTQLAAFKNIMNHNYRPVTPLNNRVVSTNDD